MSKEELNSVLELIAQSRGEGHRRKALVADTGRN